MNHASKAAKFIKDEAHTDWHNQALWYIRQNRDRAANTVEHWEQLRETAEAVKAHTISHLDKYLEQFEEKAVALGVKVHWAGDAQEHNQIVLDILQSRGIKKVVKSKSMLTEECGLNPYLEKQGIAIVDTDLGERIIQLLGAPPSHIVLPAIHLRKEEVGELFHRTIGTEEGSSDPNYLTEAARQHLREKFLEAEAGITGVNFGIAETGGFVVCTNEGNADLGTSLPPIHIACMGVEKLIPRLKDLSVFLQLLARSATGQHITAYSSHYHGPREGKELHIVIVDNGRTDLLAKPDLLKSLHCIRCGSCLNTCPVYRRSGGYSYGYTIPGPIGSILAPAKDINQYHSLPFASTLCGSCRDVCPVKVDLDAQLLAFRQEITDSGVLGLKKRTGLKMMGRVLGSPVLYKQAGRVARFLLRWLPRVAIYNGFNVWGKQRELPPPPAESFHEWYQKNRESKK